MIGINMQESLDKHLCKKYPLLYRDRHASPRVTLMCQGFAINEGWYHIVDELSAKLEAEIKSIKADGVPLDSLPVAVQVKEKFGGLRFYMDNATESMYEAIGKAEEESFHTCEHCGAEGKLRTDRSWILTYCDNCATR